jgi:cytochrome c553
MEVKIMRVQKKMWHKLGCFLMLALIVSAASGSGNSQLGKTKSQSCVACHGTDGNSPVSMYPKLAGQNTRYLVKQLKDFKLGPKGGRNNPIMYGMVALLSEGDMEDLAAYFNEQKSTYGKTQPEFLALGQKIYQGGSLENGVAACSSCHSPDGKGNSQAGYPALSGQNTTYTEAQLLAYKSGQRHNSTNEIMTIIAKKLSDDDIKAVASYINGLH